jgi:hypothetical protein
MTTESHRAAVADAETKGNKLKSHLRGKLALTGGVLIVCAIAAVFGVSSLASATGASRHAKNVTVKRVFMRGNKNPHFVAPKSIHLHDKLKIINETNPNKIGPHTFSMVQQQFIPKNNKQVKACNHKGHICRAIGKWHKQGKVRLSQAGRQGWDVEGSLTQKGDSWFTGNKLGAHFRQRVAGDAPHVLTFMCAIHPFMHGSIVVKP